MSEISPFSPSPGDDHPNVQRYQHAPATARVPERVSKGVYATGQLIFDTPKEFVIDFFQSMTRPYSVVARVVLAPQTLAEFTQAFRNAMDAYKQRWGEPPQLPTPPANRPSLQDVYDNVKLPEDQMSGNYANSVLIGHSPAEFFFDFITSFYPTSAVSSRVFLSSGSAPRFLAALENSLKQHQSRRPQNSPTAPPSSQPSAPSSPPDQPNEGPRGDGSSQPPPQPPKPSGGEGIW